jgi:predicted ATP-grasp superfamily ATP-dependent carboligase
LRSKTDISRSMRVLLAGVSTRAAAASAARAGFVVTALDAFGDFNPVPSVCVKSLPRDFGVPFSATAAARTARRIDCDTVAYLSNFENHPRAVHALASGRLLWGNPPSVLRRVRDPVLLSEALRRRGCSAPEVRRDIGAAEFDRVTADSRRWLLKPIASGGGRSVQHWDGGIGPSIRSDRQTRVRPDTYLQEFVEGTPGSVVFVAAGRRMVPLGISRQLVGEHAFGADGYRYCGNILAVNDDWDETEFVSRSCNLVRAVVEEFDLVGVNGIDFMARNGLPSAIEVNPRWCASMELVERAHEISVFGMHADACATGTLPEFDFTRSPRLSGAIGKAVVFAKRSVVVGDTRSWLEDDTVQDVPRPGERIAVGQPICTVFARGRDAETCRMALVRRAEEVYSELRR